MSCQILLLLVQVDDKDSSQDINLKAQSGDAVQ